MPLVLECACGKKLKVRDELAGKKVKCPGCAKTLPVPASEPQEDAPFVIPVEPPVAAPPKKTSSDVSAEPLPKPPGKKPPPPKFDDEENPEEDEAESKDDDDVDDIPIPNWVFPGTLSNEIMAIAKEGIWFVSLKGEALKKATRRLEKGIHPAEVFGEKAYFFPWDTIQSIYSNKKLRGFTINYTAGDESQTKALTPSTHAERDDIFKAIEKLHGDDWKRTVAKHTSITAMVIPFTAMVITGAISVGLAVLSLLVGGDWEGRGRGAALAALLNLLNWLGPLGTCGIGILIGGGIMIWMLVRMIDPPIDVTLTPLPPNRRKNDDDDD